MPQLIHPKVSGTITIELTSSEAKTLKGALDELLNLPSRVWEGKTLRDESGGQTCNQFLRALKAVTD